MLDLDPLTGSKPLLDCARAFGIIIEPCGFKRRIGQVNPAANAGVLCNHSWMDPKE